MIDLRNQVRFAGMGLVLAGLLAAPVVSAGSDSEEVRVTATVVSVEAAPGCGNIFFGSPVVYRVDMESPPLHEKEVGVIVPCIEMPMIEGNVRTFSVGDRHRLLLTKRKPYEIEVPSELPADTGTTSWYYLKRADTVDCVRGRRKRRKMTRWMFPTSSTG